MTASNIKDFLAIVRSDPDLQESLAGATDIEALVEALRGLAAARGLQFSADDVRAEIMPGPHQSDDGETELSDDELEAISGGGFIAMIKCMLTISGGTCSRTGGGVGCLSGTSRA